MSLSLTDPAPREARLSRAVDDGLVLPEAGRIAVLRPRALERFDPLPAARLHMITGFRPDHDALAQAGFAVSPAPSGRYAAALVCLPRAKPAARALIAQAVHLSDGPVLVDGQKVDGIESVLRELRARGEVSAVVSRAHGKLFRFTPGADRLSDWAAVPQRLDDPLAPGFVTLPGVFSADGVDPGSRLLAGALPETPGARVADLGAGWGVLAAQVLRRPGVQEVHLIEAEHDALDCARANVHDARARFHWADATAFTLPHAVDTVVMNPPFHAGRAARSDLGRAFIAAAAGLLTAKGTLWMVANRHLPYDAALAEAFHSAAPVTEDRSYRVWRASQPRRAR
ncbi:MAG: class I SAM-dependent methyltransferase [Rhodobacteraceae bacterium]|nr:class I SAM-dependent methyltransferase [Paracoccaceae bacterium]